MMTIDELKKLDCAALENEVQSLKKEFFNLRLSVMTGQAKDTSQFKKLRRQIARTLTARTLTLVQQQKSAENKQNSKA